MILEWACVLSWPSHLKERTLDQASLVSVLILSLILLPREYREACCVKLGNLGTLGAGLGDSPLDAHYLGSSRDDVLPAWLNHF